MSARSTEIGTSKASHSEFSASRYQEPYGRPARPFAMAEPTIIDIAHSLGREEAKRRMESRVGKLASHIPGAATVTSSWPSADRMALTVSTMGVEVPCTIDAEDTRLRVTLHLSGMLSLMAGPIAAVVRQQGERLMLEERSTTKA